MKYPISISELEDFLDVANKHTYANKDAPKSPSTHLNSEDYHFEQGNLVYHDTYYGGKDFIGCEIIYKDQKSVWGMNYYGYILSDTQPVNVIYNFLRLALMTNFTDPIPVRGPKLFTQETWRYTNTVEGVLGRFFGTEEIFEQKTLLYRCVYQGGYLR